VKERETGVASPSNGARAAIAGMLLYSLEVTV